VASVLHYGGLGLPASYGGELPLAPYSIGFSTVPRMLAVNHSMTSAPQSVPYAAPTAYVFQSQTLGGFLPSSAMEVNISPAHQQMSQQHHKLHNKHATIPIRT
jgi:hypothetical protein